MGDFLGFLGHLFGRSSFFVFDPQDYVHSRKASSDTANGSAEIKKHVGDSASPIDEELYIFVYIGGKQTSAGRIKGTAKSEL